VIVLLFGLIVLTVINMIMCVPQGQELIARIVLIPIVLLEKLSYWIRPQIGSTRLITENVYEIRGDGKYLGALPEKLELPYDVNLYRIDTRRRVWRWQKDSSEGPAVAAR
jgi:hypothetical protein